jgi:AcrR family transcriptional regulator
MKNTTTRDKILETAAKMFSERGYDRVTTRVIAKAIGINSASIYHHFPSKEAILKNLYRFYSERLQNKCPDLEELLRLAETDPPHEVLMKAEFHFDDEIRGMLDNILITAARRLGADPESERFLRENIFDPTLNIVKPLLERMVELERIEPLDIDVFLSALTFYCFSAAALSQSPFGHDVTRYQSVMSFLFSFITVCKK